MSYKGMTERQNNLWNPFGGLMTGGLSSGALQYKYNGKEFDRTHGLAWHYYGARWQDPSVGRFTSIDPLCEDYYDISPYVYCLNNPIKHIDPDGRAAWIFGGFVGAALDYGLQVGSNLKQGKSVGASFREVDKRSIFVSGVAGAAGVGLVSKAKQVINLVKLSKTAAVASEIGIDAGAGAIVSAGSQLANEGRISGKNTVTDALASAAGGKVGKYVQGKLKQTSSTYKALARDADHKSRVANNSSRPSRIEGAKVARQKAENFGFKRSTAVSSTVSTTGAKRLKEEDGK